MSTKKKISDIDKAIEEMQQRRDECFKHIGKAMYESCPELGDMSVADMRKAEHAYVVYIAFLHPRAEIIVHISLQIKQGRSHYVNRPCVLHIVDLVGKLRLNLQRFGRCRALSGLHFEPLVARYEYLARL